MRLLVSLNPLNLDKLKKKTRSFLLEGARFLTANSVNLQYGIHQLGPDLHLL